ncbi:SDR family NAD(P)-dependent oxidoreductase [Nonomuraea sp. NPDC001699]
MDISGSVALVTGANRGIGRHFVTQLLERGAKKVYATARRPELVDLPGVEVLRLDITDPASVSAAAEAGQDVTLLVNNAGIAYSAAKAAAWSLTNGVRLELRAQGTLVTGVHLGAADTDMMAGYEGPTLDPADVAGAALDGVEAGRWEVVVDEWSRTVKASLAADPGLFYAL